jgi:hypothetical protein
MLVLRLIVGTIGELQLKYECERTAWSRDIVMDMFYVCHFKMVRKS